MTKNNCKGMKDIVGHFFDNFMWYAIYLLPLILMIIYWCRTGVADLSAIMGYAGFDFIISNIVYTSLSAVFGTGGIFPVFSSDSFLIYVSYFVCVVMIHLFIDVLLWIVRWCHSIVNHGLGGASHE